jgi:polyphosphate kinase
VWVRGICALRAGVPGLSETIRVRSVLGRFLEHSRVFAFVNGGEREVWIGSADLMHRNLDRRVEALIRLELPEHVAEVCDLLDLGFDEGTSSWHLGPDDSWDRHVVAPDGTPLMDMQAHLIAAKQRRTGS